MLSSDFKLSPEDVDEINEYLEMLKTYDNNPQKILSDGCIESLKKNNKKTE